MAFKVMNISIIMSESWRKLKTLILAETQEADRREE